MRQNSNGSTSWRRIWWRGKPAMLYKCLGTGAYWAIPASGYSSGRWLSLRRCLELLEA